MGQSFLHFDKTGQGTGWLRKEAKGGRNAGGGATVCVRRGVLPAPPAPDKMSKRNVVSMTFCAPSDCRSMCCCSSERPLFPSPPLCWLNLTNFLKYFSVQA